MAARTKSGKGRSTQGRGGGARSDRLQYRARTWIDVDGVAALTDAGVDLLEQIEACGSLSQAARRLRFSYRRAWLLLDAMNRHWPAPLVSTAAGGRQGGGSRLTDLGRTVLHQYRDAQLQVEAALDLALVQLKLALRGV